MSSLINMIILAAGKGTRLKISTPKPLCRALDRPLIDYSFDLVSALQQEGVRINPCVVLGHDLEKVESHLTAKKYEYKKVIQKEQLGTGHAVQVCFEQATDLDKADYTFVLCADTPLLDIETMKKLLSI